eukprot:TRINITY_DN32437_c0_g1_i1.p1 TRINITY_DN32437_c0_g1~~TRINITY_DN32437_c0_g1_i1.p1  ORF type:complete len:724 (-),score=169.85 TRINITY_DN32437_c0_g1_i1:675-2846(-)
MASKKVVLNVSGGVGVITINNPPVNSLAPDVLQGLKTAFDEAHRNDGVKAIVVTGTAGRFSGGFDIGAIVAVQEAGSLASMMRVSVLLMIETIEAGPKPVVAAVEGLALGGGLELAMSCHARVAAPKTQLGLPELQLGIIPGFGGTQRLPRLVGLQKACEMMLTSKPIAAEEGAELGLIDEIVPASELLSAAKAWALDIAERRRPWLQSLYRTDKLEPLAEARAVLNFVREQAIAKAPHMKHPIACLDAVEAGIVQGGYKGNLKEEEVFHQVVLSDTSKSLTHVFFAQRNTTKVPGVSDRGLKPHPIKKVAVIGGGLMGSGIVTALVSSGISVILKEVNPDFLQQGLDRVKANFASRVKRGSMTKEKVEKILSLVKGTLEYDDFGSVDMVIEAVIESIPLKQKIFADLEKYCSPTCVLSSNTSTIDLNLVGAKTKSQDRIIGAHFFSPAHVMPLLEIVRTEHTSPQVILDLLTLGKNIKKTPVVVGNCTGFAVNRVFFPYTMAACLLADLGVDPYRIDKVIKGFGMPMGPFRLADLVGMGVAVAVGKQYVTDFGERTYASQLLPAMLEDNRLGEKNGKGFYLYDAKRKQQPAPELKDYLERSRKAAGLMQNGKPLTVSNEEIVEMIFFPVVNEACRVLDERVVVRAADLDIASVMAMGFPPYRGGIVFWADLIGAKYIHDKLTKWASVYGGFFKPCKYLEERATRGLKLSVMDVSSGSGRARL